MNRITEADLSFVVVQYRYSTSSDRVLTKEATWTGRVPGRSLATVMSELRRLHRRATNISIAEVRWLEENGEEARAPGRPGAPERPGAGPCCG